MKIEFAASPAALDIEFLMQKINEENIDFGVAASFAFFIRDEGGIIIAGANGVAMFGCIYTDQLWVNKKHRNLGYGKNLMKAVHDYGLQAGCVMATVNTMSFQGAREFYEKLGYVVDFERSGYNQNSKAYFMKKEL